MKIVNEKHSKTPFKWGVMYFDDFNYKYFNKVVLPSPDEIREILEYENWSKSSSHTSVKEEENFTLKEIDEILKS